MEREEFDLNNIKVAIFDFDETLAIHKSDEYLRHETEEKVFNYYVNAYQNPEIFYETIEPCIISEPLYKLINILKNNNTKMYCVSGMEFSFNLKAKEYFVHKYYGDNIEMISAGTQELKVNAVKIIKNINKCDLSEILFVDDIIENIDRFEKMGIHGLLPDDVKNILLHKYDLPI